MAFAFESPAINPPEPPAIIECAGCLAELREDDQHTVHECGDVLCLACAAENEAWPILLAEIEHPFTPSRTVEERYAAIEVIEKVLKRARERVEADAERFRAQAMRIVNGG